MKSFFAALIFASVAQAATVEFGTYSAVDADTGTIEATLQARPDNTVNLKVKTPDFEMPEPGCEGVFVVTGNLLSADMKCPVDGLEEIKVTIDITNVTSESVRSAQGAEVDLMIDALGSDPFKFYLRKLQ